LEELVLYAQNVMFANYSSDIYLNSLNNNNIAYSLALLGNFYYQGLANIISRGRGEKALIFSRKLHQ
jgi:hypothetical protein